MQGVGAVVLAPQSVTTFFSAVFAEWVATGQLQLEVVDEAERVKVVNKANAEQR